VLLPARSILHCARPDAAQCCLMTAPLPDSLLFAV
jgi:hypothetical protein